MSLSGQSQVRVVDEFSFSGPLSLMDGFRAGFRERIYQALAELERREGGKRVHYTEFTRRVSKALGRPLHAGTARKWLEGATVPDELETFVAIAEVTGVDPGWLAFGVASKAPGPRDPVLSAIEKLKRD